MNKEKQYIISFRTSKIIKNKIEQYCKIHEQTKSDFMRRLVMKAIKEMD